MKFNFGSYLKALSALWNCFLASGRNMCMCLLFTYALSIIINHGWFSGYCYLTDAKEV